MLPRSEWFAMSSTTRPTPLWASALAGVLIIAGLAATAPRAQRGSREGSDDQDQQPAGVPPNKRKAPAFGWKEVALRVYQGIAEDRILTVAGGVTFFVLLAIFPAIAAVISLYGLVADGRTAVDQLNNLSGVLPEGGTEIIRGQIEALTSQPARKLGVAMIGSLAVSLWSANGGVKAMFEALNVVYEEKESRSFFALNGTSLAVTLVMVVAAILSLLTITVVPTVLSALGASGGFETLVRIGRWPILLLTASFFIALIYRFGPDRDHPQWRWITPGSVFAAVAWLVASLAFSWYAENFGSYNKTYGSLGAVIGFMSWVWLSTIVILLGAKLNAELDRQTAATKAL
ncbi:MAG TPA: YihY/virulence factor BrkB family protein [Xanthobacteraceae bacterium]|nr:YihY/virulence factor BrkB family protein [Xanthobacteraceae bacterium]